MSERICSIRYDGGYELDPGAAFDEVATFLIPQGSYHVEAGIDWKDKKSADNEVNDQAVVQVP
jgi:hypothetical protein